MPSNKINEVDAHSVCFGQRHSAYCVQIGTIKTVVKCFVKKWDSYLLVLCEKSSMCMMWALRKGNRGCYCFCAFKFEDGIARC